MNHLRDFAKANYVPIAREDVVELLIKLIDEHHFTSFLEIGTAIGYTSIRLAKAYPNLQITTIEYNDERYLQAKQNFVQYGVSSQIRLIKDDARYFYPDLTYDLIFLDASKKCNELFFSRFIKKLSESGILIIDNLKLEDTPGPLDEKKLQTYQEVNQHLIEFLQGQKDYQVTIISSIGDGVALIKKK